MNHLGTTQLETERLLMRRFTVDDAPAMFNGWANDAEVTRWMRWTPHKSTEETAALLADWVSSYQNDDYYHWAITLKNGTLIGSLGIVPCLPELGHDDDLEPGYCIARAYWNQGYTTEALAAAMDYVGNKVGVNVMYCCHAVGNPASGRVLEKNGFVYEHEGSYTRFNGDVVPAKFYVYRKQ